MIGPPLRGGRGGVRSSPPAPGSAPGRGDPSGAGASLLAMETTIAEPSPGSAPPAASVTETRPAVRGARIATPEQLLARFGLEAFRPGQREAVAAALAGRDSLVVMPTGGGKSLCYQLPALAGDLDPARPLVVVVSPLIALMADQWRRLREAGVRGVMLASGMQEGHNAQALREIESGEAQLV